MERHGKGGSIVYEFRGDIREPYMGNTIPVSVFIHINPDGLSMVEVGTEEGGKRTAILHGSEEINSISHITKDFNG